jgi:CubicO group peptidase (beta-lactamase class C family)
VPVFADPERAARVRALAPEIAAIYRDYAESEHIPGIAYGVVVDGQLVIADGHGVADRESGSAVTPRTVFRIASMTKSFTALAVLKLRNEGRLDLDQPVSRHLPEFRKIRPLTTDAPALTIRHLLTHGAGFPEDNPWGDRLLDAPDKDLVALIRDGVRFSTTPGTAYEYSNLGFAVLGRIVNRVSGRSCQRYIDTAFLGPLGMTSTTWDPAAVPKDRLAHGYRWEDKAWSEEPQLADGSFGPMGGLLSSIEDFSHYLSLHLAAWPPRNDPDTGPIDRATLRELHHPWRVSALRAEATNSLGAPCPEVSAYGFGLRWSQDCQGRIRVGHTGGLPGFGSEWRILPHHGFGVVSFGNRTYARMARINNRVTDLLLDRARLAPRALPTSAILSQRTRELREFLPDWTNAEASPLFAVNFFLDRSVESLRRRSRELFDQAGPIESMTALQPENELRGKFTLHGSRSSVEVSFTLTPENPPRIQAVDLVPVPRSANPGSTKP